MSGEVHAFACGRPHPQRGEALPCERQRHHPGDHRAVAANNHGGSIITWPDAVTDAPPSVLEVVDTERDTTRRMVAELAKLLDAEPAQDAGGHPAVEVHEAVGRRWNDWDREVRAWRALIGPRLIQEALDDAGQD